MPALRPAAVLPALLALLHAPAALAEQSYAAGALELKGGKWFDGAAFQPRTVYAAEGRLTSRRPPGPVEVIDLGGAYVVPPLAETHSHAVEGAWSFDEVSRRLLAAGVFYVKVPGEIPDFSKALAGRVGGPGAVDVSFSHGGITGPGGWPAPLYREVLRVHRYRPVAGDLAPEWFDGRAYHEVGDRAALDRAWSALLASRPDFVKVYLECSEAHGRHDPACHGRRGLDPALLPAVVAKARAAKLAVSAHVLTAADFRAAVDAGVDEITHLPGWFLPAADLAPRTRLTTEDARRAAAAGVRVQATLVASRTMGAMRDEGGKAGGGQARNDHAHGGHGAPAGQGEAAPHGAPGGHAVPAGHEPGAGHGDPAVHGAPAPSGGAAAHAQEHGHAHGTAGAAASPAAAAEREVLKANLALLARAGVRLLVGSDHADTPLDELAAMRDAGPFDDRQLLRMATMDGPRAVFPGRRVGCLDDGCEASLLALGADPTRGLAALRDVKLLVKDGRVLELSGPGPAGQGGDHGHHGEGSTADHQGHGGH